jgi:3-isopropylmalate dehydrogenase
VVPGDGIGVEVIAEAVKALHAVADAAGKEVRLTPFDWGAERYLRTGVSLPPGALAMLRSEFDTILLGAMGDPRVEDNRHARDILLGLRFELDLYVNHRPVRLFHERLCPLKGLAPKDVDFVVFRENTEGPYVMMGGNFKRGTADEVATEIDLNTRKGVERIIRHAFAFARESGRGKVVMADKSNVLIHAHDLWQRVFKAVAAEHPEIEARHLYVDNLALQLVRDPRPFEVIVTSNMFGDIVTDLAAGLQGGLGMAASGNLHPGRLSLFEPVHGSSPPLAGKNVANPMGAILTAALLLENLGWKEEAARIEAAVRWAVEQELTTVDLGGARSTREVGDAIEARLRG